MSWQEQMQKARRRKPTEQSLAVCVDDAAVERYLVAAADREQAERVARGRIGLEVGRGQREEPGPEGRDALVAEDPAVIAARRAVDEAQAARDAATITFTFRSLAPDAFDALVAEHPPRDGNDADATFGYNVETFRPALVAACHVHYEPGDDGGLVEQDGMTFEDAVDIFTSPGWSSGDRDRLFATAWAVNQTSRMEYVSLGKG